MESTNFNRFQQNIGEISVNQADIIPVPNQIEFISDNSSGFLSRSNWIWWIILIVIVLVFLSISLIFLFARTTRPQKLLIDPANKLKDISTKVSLDHVDQDKLISQPGTPILPKIENPLARSGFYDNNIKIFEPKSPFIGQKCQGNIFDGDGAICDNGQVRVNYFYRCDSNESIDPLINPLTPNGNKCRSGSVCLAGVCTVIPSNGSSLINQELVISRHPFKLFKERSILSPNWWQLNNIQTLVQGTEPYQYYFFQE